MSATALRNLLQSRKEVSKMDLIGHDERRSRRSKPNPEFVTAVCLTDADDQLTQGKKYKIRLLPSGRVSLRDDAGEVVICNREDFDI